ncbi:purine-nucleoside phosphorylase [Novosphingobium terrae]|uniref:purine-nucleoside phosphorylase n=1 Tax=Novosphingobium terrae TaxID=2726189 RepID=UPI00197D408E|nr:purine nucleoside permease [Novosphingobium terrae]
MRLISSLLATVAMLSAAPVLAAPARTPTPARIPIKVAILTTYEHGQDKGDAPGEFQAFAERMTWSKHIHVPGVEHDVLISPDGVMGVVTGMRGRPRETLAAIISDPRFDVSHTYWVVAGIAGVDPKAAPVGAAAWSHWVVDGDPVFEMDDREISADWPYGIYALGTHHPDQKPMGGAVHSVGLQAGSSGMVWQLDSGLVDWAYGLTKGVTLADNPGLAKARAAYAGNGGVQTPPAVMLGDTLGTVRFWHGMKRTDWARNWVKTWTDGQGHFVMSACEDQGILDVLSLYGADHKVDARRVLVLRGGSNYTEEPAGQSQVLNDFTPGGALAAYESIYRTATPVVKALVSGWGRYRDTLPVATKP